MEGHHANKDEMMPTGSCGKYKVKVRGITEMREKEAPRQEVDAGEHSEGTWGSVIPFQVMEAFYCTL